MRSDQCRVDDLFVAFQMPDSVRQRLALGTTWPSRWTSSWRFQGDEISCAARDLASMPIQSSEPVRRFGWRAGQKHRPGFQFLVSTRRHHGFESLQEQRLLLALDFAGEVIEVLPQPFRLVYEIAIGRRREHAPDYLSIAGDGGRWLFDVRPAGLIGDEEVTQFAAAREAALANGWRYSVVAGRCCRSAR